MKILVLGITGMLGSAVGRTLTDIYGRECVYGTSRSFMHLDQDGWSGRSTYLDALEPFMLPSILRDKYDYVINAVGVIKPQVERVGKPNTILINSVFPRKLADHCANVGSKLIHITTDCVFSGKQGLYTETDIHDATDMYGKSKSLGEPENCMVLRTSIIGEELHHSRSLVEWIKSQKEEVNGYTNHHWNGVTTKEYAKICSKIIDQDLYGEEVFHIFSPMCVTKEQLLHLISDRFDLDLTINAVEAESSVDRSLSSFKDLVDDLSISSIEKQIEEM
jgi:dTDP-4-dehydrorhamnose reductase